MQNRIKLPRDQSDLANALAAGNYERGRKEQLTSLITLVLKKFGWSYEGREIDGRLSIKYKNKDRQFVYSEILFEFNMNENPKKLRKLTIRYRDGDGQGSAIYDWLRLLFNGKGVEVIKEAA